MCYKLEVSILWDLMPDDQRWSWYNNNRNKVHSKCIELKSSWTPWVYGKISSMKPVPAAKNVGLLFSSVQSLSRVRLFVTPWTAARQASLSITNSQTLPKLISIESVMPYNHLILCRPLLLLPSVFPSIRVFSNESVLRIRWPKYWSFSFNISPYNEHPGLISFRMD